ncbi:MAG TPA: hypothetical protein PKZ27_02735 [Rhodocyclaceae bacterium]|nr:hypothetical protein [Rhodocyclaceae bacterium]
MRYLPTGDADLNSAKVMDAVWLSIQQQNMFDFLETDVYKKGLIMLRSYYDVRVEYDDDYTGHVKITSPRSQDIILDPSIESYDTCDWPRIFKRRFVSHDDVAHKYGKAAAEHLRHTAIPDWYEYEDSFMAQQMGRLPYYKYSLPEDMTGIRGHLLLEQQYHVYKRKDVFVDVETGDTSEIPETWDRDRISRVLEMTPELSTMRKEVKTVRWTVTCEGQTLHDEDSPYDYFTVVPYFPSFIDGVTKGAVESLLDPQQLYNKVSSQELHIINTTANSGYKVKRGSLLNMTIEEAEEKGSKSGIIFEMDDIQNLEKIQPNQVPQGHDRISFKADQIMRNLAGVSNQGRGFAREDVAGEAIMANQAAQEINSAGWLNNLHRTKQMLVRNVSGCVQNFYTETRVIKINRGSAFKPEMEDVPINAPTEEGTVMNDVTRGRYATALIPSPSRTTMSEGDFKMLLELRKLGIGIPDALLIELSPAANKGKIIEMLQGDSNERQAAAEEQAAQQAAIEAEKAMATARKEEAAAMLNQARAEKAAVEAQVDPDAAYREIEHARIGVDRERMMREFEIKDREVANEEQFHRDDVALRLAEMDNDRETAVAVAKEKPAAPQRDKKPGAKKGKKP